MTPASWEWRQLWIPSGWEAQSSSLNSLPVHTTLSRSMFPSPCPKVARIWACAPAKNNTLSIQYSPKKLTVGYYWRFFVDMQPNVWGGGDLMFRIQTYWGVPSCPCKCKLKHTLNIKLSVNLHCFYIANVTEKNNMSLQCYFDCFYCWIFTNQAQPNLQKFQLKNNTCWRES